MIRALPPAAINDAAGVFYMFTFPYELFHGAL